MSTSDDLREVSERAAAELDLTHAALDEATSALSDAKAEILRLEAELEACQEPTTSMLVGSSLPADGSLTWAALTAKTGPLEIKRTFEPGLPSSFRARPVGQDIGRCVSLFSVKTGATVNQTTMRALLADVPTDHRLMFIVHHEPEDNLTTGQYVTVQRTTRTLVDQANANRQVPITFGGCLMAYTADGSQGKFPLPDAWYPGGGVWDFAAWDGYSKVSGSPKPASEIFRNCTPYNETWSLPFVIAETGALADPGRAGWITASKAWAASIGAEVYCYWNSSVTGFDYRLRTDAEFAALGS